VSALLHKADTNWTIFRLPSGQRLIRHFAGMALPVSGPINTLPQSSVEQSYAGWI
jgi:hypothetical protein